MAETLTAAMSMPRRPLTGRGESRKIPGEDPVKPQKERPSQSIWGINPQDRNWFTTLTATAGTVYAAIAVTDIIRQRQPTDTTGDLMGDIATTIAGSYLAAGFVAWAILNAKDTIMSFADSIREKTAKKIESHREEGRVEGRVEGRQEVLNRLAAEAQDKPEIMELLKQIANEKES